MQIWWFFKRRELLQVSGKGEEDDLYRTSMEGILQGAAVGPKGFRGFVAGGGYYTVGTEKGRRPASMSFKLGCVRGGGVNC